MKKKVITVISILLVIVIAVTAGMIYNRRQDESAENHTTKTQSSGTIPKLTAYYGDEKIGQIDGYTVEMEQQYIRDVIVAVAPSRQVPFVLRTKGAQVESISYRVEDVSGESLIDSGDISDFTQEDNKISFDFYASAIMETGTEYALTITVTTDEEDIYYYSRIMVSEEEFVADQIEFALEFSDKTFDSSEAADLVNYMEIDSDLANDNYGQVTLASSYSMLTWGDLSPEKVDDTTITAKEFCIKDSGEAGTYTMTYQITATNAKKVEETYNVSETITVWTYDGEQYVLAYDREINQVWTANENNIGNSFIDLGIQNTTDADYCESDNQQFIAFSVNGDVYAMDVTTKTVTTVYQLGAQDSGTLDKTKARVISVDDEGNVDYMIYGYSPATEHAGKSGISIMEYNYSHNKSTEDAFIPCQVSAGILEQQLSALCYVGDGTLYIMLDNSIYYVNLSTKEWGTLVANLTDGACVVSEDGTTIAYNTGGGEYDSDSITVVNLTDGTKKTIEAGEGEAIKVCGYIGNNLAYGLGEDEENESYSFFPMTTLKIVDENLEEIKSYSQKKVYISGVEITDTVININRWKNGKKIEDDQLLDNTEEDTSMVSVGYYNDDIKLKELAVSFTTDLDSSLELKSRESQGTEFDSSVEVKSTFEKSTEETYYVYGYGKLQGIYSSKSSAKEAARNVCGLVTDESGTKIWVFEENYN